jgi:hypothetical protein
MRRLMGYLIVVRPKYSHRQREIVNVMCGSNSLERVVSVSSAVRLVVLCRVGTSRRRIPPEECDNKHIGPLRRPGKP